MTINTIASAVCRRLGLNFSAVYDEYKFDDDLARFVSGGDIDFLSYGNADYKYSAQLPPHLGAHIIRDPRDIVVSAYFSHLYSHSTSSWNELRAHREKLQDLSKEEGIHEEIEFRSRSLKHMASWNYQQEHVLEFRFEDFISNPYETLMKVFDFYGLLEDADYRFGYRVMGLYREICAALNARTSMQWPARIGPGKLPAAELLTISWRNRFQARTAGRQKGEENTRSHYRKGQSGDWRNHLTQDHKAHFKQLYPDLVPKLGYADNDDW